MPQDNYGFSNLAIQIPQILLPDDSVDLSKWAVVACDQFTSQPEYWHQVAQIVGDAPSSLNVIFPEVYLQQSDSEQRIRHINQTMQAYLQQGILKPLPQPAFILVDRKTSQTPSRKGLIVSLDLEHYDYQQGSASLIRATEGTIVDRLPPRIKVREDAVIELPHIMVLIDDPQQQVIEPLFDLNLPRQYDVELMQNSGHISGYRIDQPQHFQQIAEALRKLADPGYYAGKYQTDAKNILLYAMGDGNHSLATAKAIWEKLKQSANDKQAIMNHPARYALVELVNLHDPGLAFEPIHRVLFDVDINDLKHSLNDFFAPNHIKIMRASNFQQLNQMAAMHNNADNHVIPFVYAQAYELLILEKPDFTLELASLESFFKQYLQMYPVDIDFIHGEDVVLDLGQKPGNIGFLLPSVSKQDLFKTIIFDGALPRKTFSMGEADEKRFYLEARRIQP